MEKINKSIEEDLKNTREQESKKRRIRRGSTLINFAQIRARNNNQQKHPEKEEAFNDSTIEVLLNSNSEMIMVIERKSLEILAVNQAVEKFLEANFVDINSLYNFFSQETLTAIASKTQSIPYQVITTPTGNDFFVNIESTPIHWSGEDALLLKITGFDSELEASKEEEYKRKHKELKAQLEAEKNILGVTAHDINNIIATVIGNLELVLDEISNKGGTNEISDFVYDCINDAMSSAGSATALTMNLLKSRHRKELDLKKADLNMYIKQIVSPLMHWQSKYGIAIRTIDNENGCLCTFDPVQMSQIIMNIMENAKDAMPSGGTITIAASNINRDNSISDGIMNLAYEDEYVCIYIEDDGTGISEKVKDKIFRTGFSTKHSTEKGFGLGLAIVKRAVEKHGGKIHVESKTGEGSYTKFYILLPKGI